MNEHLRSWETVLKDSEKRKAYESYVGGWEEKICSFLEFDPAIGENLTAGAGGILQGVPFSAKDNIAVRDFKLTCGSKMLENLTSPYNATAIEGLLSAGAVPVGKTNLDEFGMGSSTDDSALARTSNPWDVSRVAGGSSGGPVAAVAAGLVPFALGSDTGGSIRQPASFCGVYGLKPTYGVVSRYGLVAYASSLEVIGVISRNVSVCETVFNTIKGRDPKDQSSLEHTPTGVRNDNPTVGILKGDLALDGEVEQTYRDTIALLKGSGFSVIEFEMPTMEYVVPAYYTIATAEASANLARFTGIRYGYRPDGAESQEDLVIRSRSEGFGDEVKLRILLGTYVLRSGFQDQYYIKAQKIRTAIRNGFDRVFEEAEIIMMPVFPTSAFKHSGETPSERGAASEGGSLSRFRQKLADKFTASANLAGIPALSFPAAVHAGLPVGMQFIAPAFEEGRLFRAAEKLEENFPAPQPPGYSEDWRK
jgi:aspartyl-tRNA(Asn)/glutamyl-tRNA(Gln) amidotransferase subunit A